MADATQDHTAVKVAKIGAWQAVAVALIAFASGTVGYLAQRGGEETTSADSMPLEGQWTYRMDYSKFHGLEDGMWRGEGEALIWWKPSGQRYLMFVTSNTSDLSGSRREPSIALAAKAFISADDSGVPTRRRVEFTYLTRMSNDPRLMGGGGYFFSFDPIPEPPFDSFEIEYESENSVGRAVFTRIE